MAHIELVEETGFRTKNLQYVAEFNPYNGVTDELCRVFIAKKLVAVPSKPDETEEFEMILLTPNEVDTRIVNGVIWDGMTIAAWMRVRTKF